MHDIFKIISVAALGILFSACSGADHRDHNADNYTRAESSHDHAHDDHHEHSEEKPLGENRANLSETRSASSHTHGDASLAIVLDGNKITVEFDSPLYNLVGFEHAAETPAQKAAVLAAQATLSNVASLIMFNKDAGCRASNDKISVDLGLGEHQHHDDDAHEEETHKDISLQYDYICQKPKALKYVSVKLFESFENLTDIELVYLGPNTQKHDILTLKNTRIKLAY